MKEDIIGRRAEIRELERLYGSGKAEFVAVYGRRRVGKTFLVKQLFEKELVFSVAGLANEKTKKQLKNFYKTLQLYDKSIKTAPQDWLDAFDLLTRYLVSLGEGRKVILLDELPWMDTPRSGFIAALEHFWNGWASMRKDIMLVVCGSVSSWIMDKLINNHGGLHNRITKRMLLQPFNLAETEEMLQSVGLNLSRYEVAETYMIFGGIPFYLSMFDASKSLSQNVDALLFDKNASFADEFDNLYASLFRNSEDYIKIVTCLSKNRNGLTRDEIIKETGVASGGAISKILKNLEICGFIRRYAMLGGDARRNLYQLLDFFTLFHFHFLANGRARKSHFWASMQGTPAFYAWAGLSFEMLALQHAEQIKGKLGISGVMTEEYAWVKPGASDVGGAQVDLAIVRKDKTVNLCEMKFCETPYLLDKDEDMKLRIRLKSFRETLPSPTYSIQLTLVSSFGLAKGKYASTFQNEVTLDDLFR